MIDELKTKPIFVV